MYGLLIKFLAFSSIWEARGSDRWVYRMASRAWDSQRTVTKVILMGVADQQEGRKPLDQDPGPSCQASKVFYISDNS